MNWADGIKHTWHSKSNKKMSAEERKKYEEKRKADKIKQELEIKEGFKKAAERAAWVWSKSVKQESHPYCTRKKITTQGARIYKGALVIPVYKSGVLTSVQFIAENGEKRFLKGGDVSGAYGSIGKLGKTLYVCEGFATAKTIHEATGDCSVWAFNAKNIEPVVKTLRAKYKDIKLVVCADNDQWQKLNPTDTERAWVGVESKKNAGIVSAKATGELYTYPTFDKDDKDRGTDFNDFYIQYGKDDVLKRIQDENLVRGGGDQALGYSSGLSVVAMDHPAPPLSEDDYQSYFNSEPLHEYEYESKEEKSVENWQELTITDAKGNLVKTSLKNTILLFQHKEKYKNIFRYNEFSHKIYVTRAPVWEDERKFKVHELDDVDISEAASSIEYEGMSPDRTRVHNAIEVVAHKNKFHPAQDYFNSLVWDMKPRLDNWLTYYLGAEDDNAEYLAAIGKKWLVAGVARVFKAGCKFDHVLVIEGEQGKGKSTALKELATFGDNVEESYFTDSISITDIQNKDTIMKLQGSIIVELGELAGFSKKDDNEMKNWITSQIDEARLPYARTPTKFRRQFILSATTNSYDYLKDATGNRRYWPMKASGIDLDAIKHDKKQLWAEAVHLYKGGFYIGLNDEEASLATAAQIKRMNIDVWTLDVEKAIAQIPYHIPMSMERVMIEMGLMLRDRDYKSQRRIANILKMMGYQNVVKKIEGKSARVWEKIDA